MHLAPFPSEGVIVAIHFDEILLAQIFPAGARAVDKCFRHGGRLVGEEWRAAQGGASHTQEQTNQSGRFHGCPFNFPYRKLYRTSPPTIVCTARPFSSRPHSGVCE